MPSDFDVLIIGSGAGGGMAALRLCEQGFKVGLIERGPRFDPRKDYILNYSDWEFRRDPLDDARRYEQCIDLSYSSSYQHNGRQQQRRPLTYHRVHGVGGSTLHYQGEAHRFAEHSFSSRSQFGYGLDWPIGYAELAPYYQQAEQLLGVAGSADNPFKVARGDYPTPAHPLSPISQILAAGARQLGWSLLPNPLALPSRSVDGRLPCQHSGGCNYGCVFKAKSSVDQAVIPRAEQTGNLTLITDTQVSQLVLDERGDIQQVHCAKLNSDSQQIQTAQHTTLSAKRYVLAAGGVETPRLMLASGLGNHNDQVGRYFMETVIMMVRVDYQHDVRSYSGPPIDARIWDFCKPMDAQTSGFVLGSAGYLTPATGPYSHAVRQAGLGRAHKQQVRASFGKRLWLFGIAEQEARATNRITLSDATDPVGMRKVKVHCEYSPRDHHTLGVMHQKISQWANASGNMQVHSSQSSQRNSNATHVGGSCRMGDDPQHSVVDARGKLHGSSNTYIADASVLPTQGMGDSPSLTIQALALRSADFLAEDLKTAAQASS